MNKLLVHLHIFYVDQIDFFIEKLKNIDIDFDLFVTYVNEFDKQKFLKFKPDTMFKKVENRGYDVLPFIELIQSINLDDYDLILKFHTKNKRDNKFCVNGLKLPAYRWRDFLVNSIVSDKKQFRKILKIFKNPEIGMIYNRFFDWKTISNRDEDNVLLNNEVDNLNFKHRCTHYCAGTMFIARADIFKFLQNRKFDIEEFSQSHQTGGGNTLAHVYERIFTLAVEEFGYKVYTINNPFELCIVKLRNFTKAVFSIGNDKDEFGNKHKFVCILGFKKFI